MPNLSQLTTKGRMAGEKMLPTLTLGTVAMIANAVVFQCVWLINITQSASLSYLATGAALIIHLFLLARVSSASNQRLVKEFTWFAAVTLVGLVVESLFFLFDALRLEGAPVPTLMGVPYWLILLWTGFATTLHFSFRFLLNKWSLAPFVGAFACLSYLGGAALSESVALGSNALMSLIAISLTWSLVLTLLVIAYQKGWERA